MSYFQFTQSDVNNAKDEGKRELARLLSAIVMDTEAKMDDPDTYDRTYVLEDLLGRIVSAIAPFSKESFEPWADHRLAFPEMLARDESGIVRPYITHHTDVQFATELAKDTERAIVEVLQNRNREAIVQTWLLQTFDGVSRHRFAAGHSGMTCVALVIRREHGEDCGLAATHPVHETEYPK